MMKRTGEITRANLLTLNIKKAEARMDELQGLIRELEQDIESFNAQLVDEAVSFYRNLAKKEVTLSDIMSIPEYALTQDRDGLIEEASKFLKPILKPYTDYGIHVQDRMVDCWSEYTEERIKGIDMCLTSCFDVDPQVTFKVYSTTHPKMYLLSYKDSMFFLTADDDSYSADSISAVLTLLESGCAV